MKLIINKYCIIRNGSVRIDGEEFHSNKSDFNSFLLEIYQKLEMNYPKFHKMDSLCKLSVVAVESLLKEENLFERCSTEEVAIVFGNRSSSLESDLHHAKAIEDKGHYFPSPSVFVYTLPNISIGEVAIKFKIKGENAFFVDEVWNADLFEKQISTLFTITSTKAVIAGWIEVFDSSYEAFVFICEKEVNSNEKRLNFSLDKKTLEKLYGSTY